VKWTNVCMVLALLQVTAWNNNAVMAFDPCHDHDIDHKPRADVVYGGQTDFIPDPIKIPVTIDLAERYGVDIPSGLLMEGNFGMMEIYKDGHIVYNNKDISGNIEDTCNHDSGTEATEHKQSEKSQNGDHTDAQ